MNFIYLVRGMEADTGKALTPLDHALPCRKVNDGPKNQARPSEKKTLLPSVMLTLTKEYNVRGSL